MSGSFSPAADAAISMTAGSAGAAGTGAHTIAVLWKSDAVNVNGALAAGYASSTQVRQFLADSGELFGTGDFSSGYPSGGVGLDTWYVGAITKPAGSAHYRIHLWPYNSGGTGTMDHGEAPDAANHGDGSSLTEIRIGLNDVRGNGLIAVVAFADVELSDGQLDTLKSPNLSAWAALPFDEIISLENWNGTTGATAVVGTSTQSSVTGTVSVGANPPGFSFALSAAAATSGAQSVPPPLLYQLAARNQAMWQNASTATQDATVAADTIAGVTTIGTATVVTPVPAATVAGVATVGTATVSTGSTVAAAVVAGATTVGSPTVQTGSAVSPATVAGAATVGSVTVTSSAAIAPSTVAGATTIGAPTVTAVTAVSPATVAGTATVGAPTVKTGSTVTAATVAGTASIPAPSVSAGGNATVSPGVVAATATVGSPTVGAGSSVSPSMVAAAAAVGSPTVKTSVTITLTTVAGVAAIAAPTVTSGALIPGVLSGSTATSTLRGTSATSTRSRSGTSSLHSTTGP